ncbi:MAG TPA: energy transducer TonB, partial [Opitutaceae bacterium]|nr:energy transducer TonB [Opitutaceae bacterium]
LLQGCASALEDSGNRKPGETAAAQSRAVRPGFALEHGEVVLDVTDVQVIPKLSRHVPPQYPFTLPTHGIEGSVMLWVVVLAGGGVGEVSVESSTNAEFEPSAVEAVRHWKFEPALRDDVPVACRIRVPVEFNKPRPKSR